ncbi:hypothetical protein BX666DRAFT_1838295, partial [Dichotomocladium elegans]
MPRHLGGVGLLNVAMQHLILQMKWLIMLFSPQPSLVQVLLRHHFRLMGITFTSPILPFFCAIHRTPHLCHPTSVIPIMFTAFDHLNVTLPLEDIPLKSLLLFPLHSLFTRLPESHWLERHPKMLANAFFRYDQSTNRLIMKRPGEYNVKPRLLSHLW